VSGPIAQMIADWTIKPKKRENRVAEFAGLPCAGMSPNFCHLIKAAVGLGDTSPDHRRGTN
jgi:hypothetical protein